MEVDLISKKESCKRNLIWFGGSNDSKVVLILLTEVITLYMRPTGIDIKRLSFEFILR